MTSMMMERTGMNMPAMASAGMTTPMSMPTGAQSLMIPRCTMKMESSTDGMKMSCTCDDKAACTMMQNLCTMMAGGMVELLHDDERHGRLQLGRSGARPVGRLAGLASGEVARQAVAPDPSVVTSPVATMRLSGRPAPGCR